MTHRFNQTTPVPPAALESVCPVVRRSSPGMKSHLEKQAPAKLWWKPSAWVEMLEAQTAPDPSGSEGSTTQGSPVPQSFSRFAKASAAKELMRDIANKAAQERATSRKT